MMWVIHSMASYETVTLDERYRFYIPLKMRKSKDLKVGDIITLKIRLPENQDNVAGSDIIIDDSRYRVTVFSNMRKILGITEPGEVEVCIS